MPRQSHIEPLGAISSAILLGGGGFCALVFSYVFYHYGVTHQRQFTSPFAIIPYYCVPAALAALLFGALSLKRSQRINIAIFFVSLAVSTYGGEVFFTISGVNTLMSRAMTAADVPQRKYEVQKLAKDFDVKFDFRSKIELIRDLRLEGIDAVPSIVPLLLLRKGGDDQLKSKLNIRGGEVFPLGGISNRVTVFCNETGRYLIYDSDEHGFHNPRGIWQSNQMPIVAVGDSFAVGGCVPSGKGFVSLIRNHYPGTLNLGMPGAGPLTMLAALKEYLPAVRPKIVFWFYSGGGSIENLQTEEHSPLLMRYLEDHFKQNLVDRQPEIDQALLKYSERQMSKELGRQEKEALNVHVISTQLVNIAKLSTLREKMGLVLGASPQDSVATKTKMALFRTILLDAKKTAADSGATLYFVYLPPWERYANPELASQTDHRYRDWVLTLVKSLDIPTIDIDPAFQAQKDPLSLFSFRRFGHYNEEGHRVVAEKVLGAISGTD
jgi:hypothetical protein